MGPSSILSAIHTIIVYYDIKNNGVNNGLKTLQVNNFNHFQNFNQKGLPVTFVATVVKGGGGNSSQLIPMCSSVQIHL